MDRAELATLLDLDTLRLVAELRQRGRSYTDLVREVEALRRAGHPPSRVATALTQVRLGDKALAKFGESAHDLLYTEAGLQQATRLRVAAVHASRYRRAGLSRVIDLGCGIGGDALAFAAAGIQVRAVESDSVTAAIASYNLAGFENAQVIAASAEQVAIAADEAVWADPARRRSDGVSDNRRLYRAADYSPSVDWLIGLAAERPVGMKLGPATERAVIPKLIAGSDAGIEAQWVSHHGDVVELALWLGSLARRDVGRSALLLADDGVHELTAHTDLAEVGVGSLGAYLHEPNGAVLRARLLPLVADPMGAHLVSAGIGYLTSDTLAPGPWHTSFRVLAELSFDERVIRRELAARHIGVLEIKKRGVELDPTVLRRRLRPNGTNQATLVVTKLGGRVRAILAERVDEPAA